MRGPLNKLARVSYGQPEFQTFIIKLFTTLPARDYKKLQFIPFSEQARKWGD
jgi:hypothetical protein